MRIPMFPAIAEKIAPMIKAGTINQCVVGTTVEIPNRAAEAMTTKMASKRYSADRKAMAPSLMLLAMPCIFSSPAGCFFTQAILTSIKSKPTSDKTIGM